VCYVASRDKDLLNHNGDDSTISDEQVNQDAFRLHRNRGAPDEPLGANDLKSGGVILDLQVRKRRNETFHSPEKPALLTRWKRCYAMRA